MASAIFFTATSASARTRIVQQRQGKLQGLRLGGSAQGAENQPEVGVAVRSRQQLAIVLNQLGVGMRVFFAGEPNQAAQSKPAHGLGNRLAIDGGHGIPAGASGQSASARTAASRTRVSEPSGGRLQGVQRGGIAAGGQQPQQRDAAVHALRPAQGVADRGERRAGSSDPCERLRGGALRFGAHLRVAGAGEQLQQRGEFLAAGGLGQGAQGGFGDRWIGLAGLGEQQRVRRRALAPGKSRDEQARVLPDDFFKAAMIARSVCAPPAQADQRGFEGTAFLGVLEPIQGASEAAGRTRCRPCGPGR